MIEPIALFRSNDGWTNVSIVKDTTTYDFLLKHDGLKVSHDGYLYLKQKGYLRELASKLGKFTNKPISERKHIIQDIIFSIARVSRSHCDNEQLLFLAKDEDRLFTKPYNTKPHYGQIQVTPIGVRLTSERNSSSSLQREIAFSVKINFRDDDFDGEGNRLFRTFKAQIFMNNYCREDGCKFSHSTEEDSGLIFGLDSNDIFYSLLASLIAKRPVDFWVKLFKDNEQRKKDLEEFGQKLCCHIQPDNYVKNEGIKELIEGYKELKTDCGDFFKNVSFEDENLVKNF